MILSLIIAEISIIIWYFPAIKQRKSEYFPYFFILALLSPLRIGLFYFGGLSISTTELSAAFLILSSLFYKDYPRLIYYSIIIAVLLYFISTAMNPSIIRIIKILIHSSILLIFIRRLLNFLSHSGYFSIFIAVLILEELSTILKNITVLADISTGEVYFYLTTVFQLLFGIYFSFFKEETHKLHLS